MIKLHHFILIEVFRDAYCFFSSDEIQFPCSSKDARELNQLAI